MNYIDHTLKNKGKNKVQNFAAKNFKLKFQEGCSGSLFIIHHSSFIVLSTLLTIGFMLGAFAPLKAQQDAQYTQFMFNKLVLNPAYAGSSQTPCLSLIHRRQWVGLEGAPVTSAISFNTPFSENRVGFGLNLEHDQIGPTKAWNLGMAYAYRIHLKKGVLSLGLQASIRQFQIDWLNENIIHTGDLLINNAANSKLLPNVGLGIYYESPSYYFGVSAPRLLKGDLSLLDEVVNSTDLNSLEEQHIFAMAGFLIDLNDHIKLKPATLFKIVKNAPIDADLNLSLIFYEKLWLGTSVRWGGSTQQGFAESLDFFLQFQVSDGLRLGAGYDFTLSEINSYNNGTYEFYAHYCFKPKEFASNPRFF